MPTATGLASMAMLLVLIVVASAGMMTKMPAALLAEGVVATVVA